MDNKDAIMVRAVGLFASRGYDAVGVQELVEGAGVTKPTLYHYFGSKKGLLDAILADGFEGLIGSLKAVAVNVHDMRGTLTGYAKTFFDFAAGKRDFYRMALSLYFAPPQSEANLASLVYHREIYDIIEAAFRTAGDYHGNMKGRHAEFAASFIGLLNTFIGMYFNGYVELDDKLVYEMIRQFMYGIFS